MRRLARHVGRFAAVTSLTLVGAAALATSAGAVPPTYLPLMNGAQPAAAQHFYDSSATGLSCQGAGTCTVVGQYQRTSGNGSGTGIGFTATESSGSWSAASAVTPPAPVAGTALGGIPSSKLAPILSAITCTSAGNCTGVGEANYGGTFEAIAATQTSGTWGTPVVVLTPYLATTTAVLDAVSCAAPGDCTAVGTYTDASNDSLPISSVETSGRWSTATNLVMPSDEVAGQGANPQAITCPSAGNCVVVGEYTGASGETAFTATSSSGAFAQAVAVSPPTGPVTLTRLDGIWCADVSDCVAVGTYGLSGGVDHGMAVVESAGTWGAGTATDTDTSTTELDAVSCSDTSDCTALGYIDNSGVFDNVGFVESAGTWGSAVTGPAESGSVPAAACAASSCTVGYGAAIGNYRNASVDTFGGSSFGTPTTLAMPADNLLYQNGFFFSATCPSATTCDVLGAFQDQSGNHLQAYVATYVNGVVSTVTPLAMTEPESSATNYLGSISCGATGDCAAYFEGQGYGQQLDVESGGTWGAPTTAPGQLASLSCVGASWCVGVGGDISTIYSSGSWSATTTVPNTTNLYGVSCWAVGSCEAVGDVQNGNDYGLPQEVGVQLTSSTWQSTVLVAPPNANPSGWEGSLNGISCDASGSCLAVGGYSDSSAISAISATVTHGSWSSATIATLPSQADSSGTALFSGVSCKDASDCVAVGDYTGTQNGQQQAMQAGGTSTSQALSASPVTSPYTPTTDPTSEPTYLNAVACQSTSMCALVGYYFPYGQTYLPAIAFAGTPPPDAPTNVQATGKFGQVKLTWDAASSSGPAVTSYTATVGGKTCTTSGLTCTVTGLQNETTYQAWVSATSSAGTGPISTPVSVTVITYASAPTGLQVVSAGDRQIDLSWTASSDNGGSAIQGYVVTYTTGTNRQSTQCPPSPTTCSISVTDGFTYQISVAARNAAGVGPATPSVSTASDGPPYAPTGVKALAGNAQLKVEWTPPTLNGGSPITTYTASAGAATCTSSTTSCVITGLKNGTAYTVHVTASNVHGTGPASTSVIGVPTSGKPKGPPGPVTHLTAKGGHRQVALHWRRPSNVGTGLAYYEVCLKATPPSCLQLSGTSYTFGNLKRGTTYTFSVTVVAKDGETSKAVSIRARPTS